MQSIRTRQLRADISYDGTKYTASKPWEFGAISLNGADVATSLVTNTNAIVANYNRLDSLIDSGTTLDTISELKAAWEGGDSDMVTAVAAIAGAATADRAAIRTEFAAADTTATTDRAAIRSEAATQIVFNAAVIRRQERHKGCV